MAERFYPRGRKENQPIVRAKPATVELLGTPIVNYDKLDDLVHGKKFKLPDDFVPSYTLGGRATMGPVTFHVPFTASSYINAVKAVDSSNPDALTEALLYSTQRIADSYSHRGKEALNVAAYGSTVAPGLLTPTIKAATQETFWLPPIARAGLTVLSAAALGTVHFLTTDRLAAKARQTAQNEKLIRKYRGTIVFPSKGK